MLYETMKAMQALESHGYNFDNLKSVSGIHVNDSGNLEYNFMAGDITGYTMELDPETGESRHRGNGPGCFWTYWG